MSQKKNYSRYFIILQEDEKGYGLASDKLPTGYAKLEVKNGKCKISFYVQNLKKEMKPYYMLLIFNKNNSDKKLIKLGELNIDDTGRAEIGREYEADNVASTSMQIDKICGAAVTRFVDTNMVCIMSGFTNTGDITGWKEYELVDGSKSKERTKFDEYEEKIEKSKEEVKYIKKEEIEKLSQKRRASDENGKKELKDNIKDNLKDNIEEKVNNKHISEKRENKESEKAKDIQIEVDREDILSEQQTNLSEETVKSKAVNTDIKYDEKLNRTNLDTEVNTKKSKSDEFFTNIAEDLEQWEDEFEEVSRCKWFKVDVGSIEDMYRAKSYNKYSILYYPMTNYFPYIIRHGHYMFGYKYDKANKVKYLVYAIPGTKAHYDQPFGGKYGFVSWTQPKHNKGKYGNMGYWLMFYDFRKSVVVIPANR